MCGIVGCWSPAMGVIEVETSLRRMNQRICHRGPDDSGYWVDETTPLGFGHRRLSILDLSVEGHQPKFSPGRNFVTVFNGEIYNFTDLRDRLAAEGHSFRGRSDTEVLLAGFEGWGVHETIRRAAGMFAIAVWDIRRRRLSLARDRMGEKPLYYGWSGGSLLFASELKAMREHPHWSERIDRAALDRFLRFGYVPAPRSIYENISKLPPGSIIDFNLGHDGAAEGRERPYWSLEQVALAGRENPARGTEAELLEEFEVLLRQVVKEQMVSDVPLGAFLSGGVDSSTIVALMQAQSRIPVRTFTIGFHERGFNEAEHAKAVAQHLGTAHTEMYVTSQEALSVIPKLPEMYDEPFADPSQIPTYLVATLARQHVTVSLSGDGGDELFAGYNRYFHGERIYNGIRAIPRAVRAVAARGARAIPPRAWDEMMDRLHWLVPRQYQVSAAGDKMHKLADILTASQPHEVYHQLTTHWRDSRGPDAAADRWPAVFQARTSTDFVCGMMFADASTYLPDDILVKVDRATMAVSLESRAPFLDHRVVEFAWRLPMPMKLRGRTGKWLLRELLYRYVPRQLIERPKMGFGVPIDSWLRGPLREWGETLLEPSRIEAEGLLDARAVTEKWNEHQAGVRNWQYLLWDVLMFQAWRNAR